jgi:hypothetical protein
MVLIGTYVGRDLRGMGLRICSRCIYDESIHGIEFDSHGVCNYCQQVEGLREEYGTGAEAGIRKFEKIVDEIKKAGNGKRYDVVIGVSGGTDSSYMLHLARCYGLRPLAVHYDNTWNTAVATQNISAVTSVLDIDLSTHVCDAVESADIFRSFFLAGVPEIDGPTDLAITEVLYRAAARHGTKYVFEGHSFLTEGISPLGRSYIDGAYVAGIHARFGSVPMRSYPNMGFWRFLYWSIFRNIRRVRPFWYLPYSKAEGRSLLEEEYGWKDYGGHHLENRMTAFNHSYYFPTKFDVDQRNNSLSAACRTGLISREDALAELASPPYMEANLLEYVRKRFGIDEVEWLRIMTARPRSYLDYRTYKKRFEMFRPVFAQLVSSGRVPASFYLKYCFPQKVAK